MVDCIRIELRLQTEPVSGSVGTAALAEMVHTDIVGSIEMNAGRGTKRCDVVSIYISSWWVLSFAPSFTRLR